MNIGIVTTWFERGAAYVSRQYLKALQPRHQVKVYVRSGEDRAVSDPNWAGPHVTWGKECRLPTMSAIDIRDMVDWIRKNRLDVVFFNEQHWWEPVVVCTELGIRTGSYIDYYTEETIPLFGLYDFVICNTKRHHSAFADHHAAFYVPWGTEVGVFKSTAYEQVSPGLVTFFHSCGYSPKRKGTDVVLKAFDLLDREDCRLVVHTQQPLCAQMKGDAELIDRLVACGRLNIIERTVGAPGLYGLGDVYVAPSRLEGLGLPIAEALASALPVITTDAPPMSEFVNREVGRLARVAQQFARSDGYFWPQTVADPAHIAEHMNEYADMGADIKGAKMAARSFAESNLDWSQRTEMICDIFERAGQNRSADMTQLAARARYYDKIRGDLRLEIARKFPTAYGIARRVIDAARGGRVMG